VSCASVTLRRVEANSVTEKRLQAARRAISARRDDREISGGRAQQRTPTMAWFISIAFAVIVVGCIAACLSAIHGTKLPSM
jgi:hypothetical protein